ncbi:mast cell protease 4-like [Centropristis striata]|uniref:mast cell protease 4-like n=1 Tax=Centropristis striata TaxID=184440 RepID=UPI0027DED367|nr:mast cell protease 4-like [Centropristis striata]
MDALHRSLLLHLPTCLGQHAYAVINGEKAAERSMPYMVSVQNRHNHHVCGGFLIRQDFVVTAANCGDTQITHVVVGTNDLKKANRKKISIKDKHKRPYYTTVGNGFNIMLLKLSKKAKLDNSIRTIPLPSPTENIKDNTPCRVAGWGSTRTGGAVVDELRVVDVSTIKERACENVWGSNLPPHVICAGGFGTNKGFCQGDAGGPLVCNGKAVGVASHNQRGNCNYPDVPNVYTDISKYITWINSIINSPEPKPPEPKPTEPKPPEPKPPEPKPTEPKPPEPKPPEPKPTEPKPPEPKPTEPKPTEPKPPEPKPPEPKPTEPKPPEPKPTEPKPPEPKPPEPKPPEPKPTEPKPTEPKPPEPKPPEPKPTEPKPPEPKPPEPKPPEPKPPEPKPPEPKPPEPKPPEHEPPEHEPPEHESCTMFCYSIQRL